MLQSWECKNCGYFWGTRFGTAVKDCPYCHSEQISHGESTDKRISDYLTAAQQARVRFLKIEPFPDTPNFFEVCPTAGSTDEDSKYEKLKRVAYEILERYETITTALIKQRQSPLQKTEEAFLAFEIMTLKNQIGGKSG